MPLISVIVPIYNVEKYLCRCIDSLLQQTFRDFELILVDDGSKDNSPAICDEYKKKDSRIIVIHKKNGGLSDARNTGKSLASGKYFAFVDSDDYIAPDMYEKMYNAICKYDADIVACGYYSVDAKNNIVGKWPDLNEDKIYFRKDFIDNFYPDVRRNILPSAVNKLYKREIFDGLDYPKGRIYEDAFVQLDILNRCEKIYVLHDHLYFYFYNRNDSIINGDFSSKRFDSIDFSKKQFNFFCDLGNIEQQQYSLAAYLNYAMMNKFAVDIFYKELKKEYDFYKKDFLSLLPKLLINPKICKLKKLVMLLIFISPKTALRLCRKYFPECLYDFMR